MSSITVNFKGTQKRVSDDDADRQASTMRLILDKLRTQPGVILCDEVGMGKTYVALGVIAQYLVSYPRSRVLVLTPSTDLAEKWTQDLERFRRENVHDHVGRVMRPQPDNTRNLDDLLGTKNKSRVWILPVSVFFHSHRHIERRSFRDTIYQLISRGANLCREERKALWRRLGGRARTAPRPRKNVYWNGWRIPSLRNVIHSLLEERGCHPFDPESVPDWKLRWLQDDIRWRLIKIRLRHFSLIVVDEAHHLRNPDTKRYRSLEGVFDQAFRDMLFLTATPFQLGPDELENIMVLFRLSTERAARDMAQEAKSVTTCAREYQDRVRSFERAWQQLSDTEKQAIYDKAKFASPGIKSFCEAYKLLQQMHEVMEQTLSKWVIRNVKERPYRISNEGPISLGRMDQLPFAILHRLLYEYQRQRRTFSATQNVSLTSSWAAFRASAVMNGRICGSRPVTFYRKAMRFLVDDDDAAHPKFLKLLNVVKAAFAANEKVLVFTSRIETVRSLQTRLNAVLEEEVYGQIGMPRGEVDKRLRQLRKRMTASRDTLWLLFQENYFRSCLRRLPAVDVLYDDVLRGLYRLSGQYRVGLIGKAKSPNWQLLTYVCEWMVFGNPDKFPMKHEDSPQTRYWKGNKVPYAVDRRIRPLRNVTPDDEEWILRRHGASRAQLKNWLRRIIRHRSVWDEHSKDLAALTDLDARENLLEAVAGVLAVPELLGKAIGKLTDLHRGQAETAILRVFNSDSVKGLMRRFLWEMRTLPSAEVQAYTKGLATESLVARASGNESSADRLRHRYGFNTPFRPYVLIASEVMQEGLDLHRECSRIVHYDLAWNPARLEQRVGRIDRLGSLVERRLQSKKTKHLAKLNIHRHYIPGTIDERMFNVVRDRERWFKFILGHRPEWDTDVEDRVDGISLPDKYGKEFQIRLCPS
ncbi:MAG: DEAD/DEAH box helicase family protein [Verrucomicrobia bacterium]|nr:DEAD/DEAH box helicase family protein [Verrucomicrobiota bacterium]MBU4289453.1 DEAD/DEAH box helicase family protein [Verrucomicrobiota bacterium]MBU4428723.1 DEAD/DEAH box helicase family protein [Verrucomicrobiota bacterium]MBU4497267.1 DEAD/DEAH box helicase family protein [Verrucomicrobiota bacterium]MCG2679160.1 DEAD/DEAH box helicase family protein [Kiritimatiellia bacterium]